MLAESVCPEGFMIETGDITGEGLEVHKHVSLTACAANCTKMENCKSFSHSPSHKHCKLMQLPHPTTQINYEDFMFCSKIANATDHGNILMDADTSKQRSMYVIMMVTNANWLLKAHLCYKI